MTDKLIVFGASGSVGRRVVYHASRDSRFSVTAVLRSDPKQLSFYGAETGDIKQLRIDYNNISEQDLEGYTCGISCLGVYTSSVKDYKSFQEAEARPNVSVAEVLAKHGVTRYAYLSGSGASRPSPGQISPKLLQPMFSYVKGSTEQALAKIMPSFTAVRPAAIIGRATPMSGMMGHVEGFMNRHMSWCADTSVGIHVDVIALALLESVSVGGRGDEILENNEIKRRVK